MTHEQLQKIKNFIFFNGRCTALYFDGDGTEPDDNEFVGFSSENFVFQDAIISFSHSDYGIEVNCEYIGNEDKLNICQYIINIVGKDKCKEIRIEEDFFDIRFEQ